MYWPLVERLRGRIREGELGPGQMVGSETGMATQTGLSRKSVRRAVEQLIGEGLVERRPGKGVFVREPRTSTRQVQIVVPSVTWDRCARIVQGAKRAGQEDGVCFQIYDAHDSMDTDIEIIRNLPRSAADGAIIVAFHHRGFAGVLYELHREGYPFVLVDMRLADADVPSVVADNYGGGYRVGQELVRRGHRRIGYIGTLNAHTIRERLDGLRDAVNDAGLPFDRSLAVDLLDADGEKITGDWRERVCQRTRELLRRDDRPSAVFFSCDSQAMVGYRAIKELGLRIPKDLSVVGFDGDEAGEWLDPGLTTVSQQAERMGSEAVAMLTKRLARRNGSGEAAHRVVETVWVERESVARSQTR
ncbi:MAG: substrate-binding domain-containing protein [Phycisphaerae bacterium]|nr:substrate-binding domain-containing protein [Phycisphaerae bacterium]